MEPIQRRKVNNSWQLICKKLILFRGEKESTYKVQWVGYDITNIGVLTSGLPSVIKRADQIKDKQNSDKIRQNMRKVIAGSQN